MATLRMEWTISSKPQFDELRKRAIDAEKLDQFIRAHNEIVVALRDLNKALE